jgi:hypothetical protein
VDVYLLWHAHHADNEDGRQRHRESVAGRWYADEEAGDDEKLLGVYSTNEAAEARIQDARGMPGFQDEPDCFLAQRYEVDHDEWTTGFVVLKH